VETLQRLDKEEVDGEPDGSTPVGITAKLDVSSASLHQRFGQELTMPDRESPGQ
jgi:hypothetical protein